jgi:thermitase
MIQGRILKVLSLGLLGVAFSAHAAKYEAVPGEYVVKLKNSFVTMSAGDIGRSMEAEVIERLSPESRSILIRRPQVERAEFAVRALKQNPLVEYAEPNYIYRIVGGATSLPNDPKLNKLWGLHNTGEKSNGDMGEISGKAGIDIDAHRAWEIETGNGKVVIASIDTGVDYTIEDLAPNMWVNEAEKNGRAGIDDDNNGVIDDIHGYNAITGGGDPKDDHGHGSHTSGTIAARGNDGKGVVGVNWDAKIMAIKFLAAEGGGTLDDAVKAIDYAIKMKADIMTNSWGGGPYTQSLYDAIKRAKDAGILFVAAAGNAGTNVDESPEYPAAYDLDNILSVAAIDNAGEMAYFSCYGKKAVDVAAPGVNILSTVPGGYEAWSGTSMAAPHVTGVAALLKAANPDLGWMEIKERIMKTAVPLGSLRGKIATGGLVNAYNALTNTMPEADPNDPFNWDKDSIRVSTPHPYADNFKETYTVKKEGATKIAIYFSKFDTEQGYDKVEIKDGAGQVVAVMSGLHDDTFTPVIEGDTATVTIIADDTASRYGFDIEGVAYK